MTPVWKYQRGRVLASVLLAGIFAASWCFAQKSADVFSLEPHEDLLYVPVTFGGSTHICEIDSGTTGVIFHNSVKNLLGRPEAFGPGAIAGPGLRIAVQNFEPMDFQIGSAKFHSEDSVQCCDMTSLRESRGMDIEGLIGIPLFHSRIIRIDFDNRRLEILPKSTSPRPEWGKPVILFEGQGQPKIDIDVGEGEKVRYKVDTGFNGTLTAPHELYSRLMKTNALAHMAVGKAISLAGPVEDRYGLLSKIRIGDFEPHDLGVDDGPDDYLLGIKCLSRFRVTFDLPHGKLYLAKGDRFKVPDKFDPSDIQLLRRQGKTLIDFVTNGSAADEAGVRVNDELIAIADEPVAKNSIADVNWKLDSLRKSTHPFQLQLGRDGTDITVVVRPH